MILQNRNRTDLFLILIIYKTELDEHTSGMDNIQTELDKHNSDMGEIRKTDLDEHNSDIGNIQTEFDEHNSDMDKIQIELDECITDIADT